MLKQLISLFAEKFLTSRYSDITYHVGGNASQAIGIVVQSSEFTYIAPKNGYVTLRVGGSANTWFRVENQTSRIAYLSNASGDWKTAYVFAKKGDKIYLDVSQATANSGKASCYFSPCVSG